MVTSNEMTGPQRVGFGGSSWQVHKFGGTSVASADCFRTVAQILRSLLEQTSDSNSRIAVVVSAIGGKPKTTDLLLHAVEAAATRDAPKVEEMLQLVREKHETCLIDLFPDNFQRLLDVITSDIDNIRDILKTVSLMKWQATRIQEMVSGYGELWSTQILTQLMDGFEYLDARKLITIDEDAIQDGAVVWETCAASLTELGLGKKNFVMTGYVASNTQGVATTLQRDGSDYSAAILGRLLSANTITIWTDVDGVLSADPRRVPLAQVIPEVSFNEAMELAYFGAKVIHPKTMQPAVTAQIPIYIRNTFNPAYPGSRIFTSSSTGEDKVVCAFSSIEKMALVNVEGSGLVGVLGVCRRLFGTLQGSGVNVVLISQASSEHSITFATTQEQVATAKAVIEEEFRRELDQNRISKIDVKEPCSIIAAVGDSMSSTMGCSGRFFSALGDAKVNVLAIAQGSSERNISAVVHSEDSTRALRAVHAAFRLSHTSLRIGIVGMNEVGEALVRLLGQQREKLRTVFDLDLQVCVVFPQPEENKLIILENDSDASTDSISAESAKKPGNHVSEGSTKQIDGGLEAILQYLERDTCTNHVIFDCTNDERVGRHHANWLRSRIDVVTANNTGLSGPKSQRAEIRYAERAHGKQSASYLREVTVGGGLPILKTLRSLVNTGDTIRRIDGILSVSLSYIMFRISPPPMSCSAFDEKFSNGAFNGDVTEGVEKSCSFSQAVREAIDLGLMEKDPTHDLDNEYTARVLMVLAKELGIASNFELRNIMQRSHRVLEGTPVDYNNLTADVDEMMRTKVESASLNGCVLRHIASVDVQERNVGINIVEVPYEHLFAITPPSCECVRFFTDRHQTYPLVVQGPSAGADSTASALLAELLYLMRGKSSPQTVALSRSESGKVLGS